MPLARRLAPQVAQQRVGSHKKQRSGQGNDMHSPIRKLDVRWFVNSETRYMVEVTVATSQAINSVLVHRCQD